jgi:hypothetical protein
MTKNKASSPCETGTQYECRECLARHCVTNGLSACPDCGGDVENLSKPRE